MMITILGSSGFVGTHLKKKLETLQINYQAPHKNESLAGKDLGTLIYCIGLTADFREKPLETVEAHVCKLLEITRDCRFERILYLSSTRVYKDLVMTAREDSDIRVAPSDPSDLYNISKLLGEAVIHSLDDRGVVVRLSNVYGKGSDTFGFLPSIIRDAITTKRVVLETTMDSEKDYVNIEDVVALLIQIANKGTKKIYNIASGINLSNRKIMGLLSTITGCDVSVSDGAKTIKFPIISIEQTQAEFGYKPRNLLVDLETLIEFYRIPEN